MEKKLQTPVPLVVKEDKFQFYPPARQVDFPDDPGKQAALEQQWNTNLDGFTNQSITGNPWNTTNSSGITNYYNPISNPTPSNAQVLPITWQAFPGRISRYNPSLSAEEVLSLADTGYMLDGTDSFPPISVDPCTNQPLKNTKPYGPYGPRGWQDEYCEWAVTRDTNGKILRIDFTCENPEYWNTLWMIDPNQVLSLYQNTLNKPQIQLEDLYLYDSQGNPVIDPSTGRPAYNPLNKWNSGPFSSASSGGAIHLTSTPNTLQTEIGLAGAATIQRTVGNNNPNTLICCAQYGQPWRNSDPNIGASTNQVVSAGMNVTLTNPPGLYIQLPDFSGYETPDGTNPASFWKIVRGSETLQDGNGSTLPGNFILHAVFEVPSNLGYTVSDIKINGANIKYGGQVAQTFLMQIVATGSPASVPAAMACVADTSPATTLPQPLQMFHQPVFEAMASQAVANPVKMPMALISNSTLIAPIVEQGTSSIPMVLTASTVNTNALPVVTIDGNGDVKATVNSFSTITYAVPGNSYPSQSTVLYLSVYVSETATLGLRNIYLANTGETSGPAMPALLNVVPAGTIATKKGGR